MEAKAYLSYEAASTDYIKNFQSLRDDLIPKTGAVTCV